MLRSHSACLTVTVAAVDRSETEGLRAFGPWYALFPEPGAERRER